MKKNTLILIISCCIVLVSAAILAVGPITNKKIGTNWGYQNCGLLADQTESQKDDIQKLKDMKNLCRRQKTMYDLEYGAFIINVIAGFISFDLALLHYMDISKDFEIKAGVISCAAGFIGLVLSLVYACYNGYIFTKDVAYMELNFNHDNYDFITDYCVSKLYSNGASQHLVEGEYITDYENDRKSHAQCIRYKDLGKSQYNYDNDYYKKYNGYTDPIDDIYKCRESSYASNCEYLYALPETDSTNKELYNRWLTALILACFVAFCDLLLTLLGVLSFANFGITFLD